MSETKKFTLRTCLTVTTGLLLTKPRGERDNGIDDLYQILSWMTGKPAFTHVLPDLGDECKPVLLKKFPELAMAGDGAGFKRWQKNDHTGGEEAIKMWLTELKMLDSRFKDQYEIEAGCVKSGISDDPLESFSEKFGGTDKVIAVVGEK